MSAKFTEKQLIERPFLDDLDVAVYCVAEALAITEVLAEHGFSATEALEGTGISRRVLHDPHARISTQQRLALYRNALRLGANSGIGLDVGTRLHLSNYGRYGFALLSSPTLGSFFDFGFKYMKLAGPLMEKTFVRRGPLAYYETRDALGLGDLLPFTVDMCFGSLISVIRDGLGGTFVPGRVEVSFARPPHADRYMDAWGCEVRFNAPRCRLEFDASLLECSMRQSSELTLKLCAPVCERMLLALGPGRGGSRWCGAIETSHTLAADHTRWPAATLSRAFGPP